MPFFIFFLEIPIKEVLDGSREGYEASASIFRSRSRDRSGTIVFRREVSETLRWQPSLLLRRWLVLAFIVSLIMLIGALSFASGEAYGKDGGQSSPTSGDSGGGGGSSDKGGSGGGDKGG